MRSTRNIKSTNSLLFFVVALGLSGIIYSGCSQGFSGDPLANARPEVRFVNVPPDNSNFSANPRINWVGTDRDGRVVEFRHVVARVADVPVGMTPGDYALGSIPFSEWSVEIVTLDDPANSATILLAADSANPVKEIVEQYLFLVAVDDKGAISNVVYRTFGRNDHFPDTRLIPPFAPGGSFVNVPLAQFGFGGIPIEWSGSDPLDFPGTVEEDVPLEFEWKLYGPFTQAESTLIIDSFLVPLFVTTTKTYGLGETLVDTAFDFTKADTAFDSSMADTVLDSITPGTFDSFFTITIAFDSISVHVDSVARLTIDTSAQQLALLTTFGHFETVVDTARVDSLARNPAGASSPVVDSSLNPRLVRFSFNPATNDTWTSERAVSFTDLFRDDPLVVAGTDADTTRQNSFLFWVRSRDDAFVPDPAPAFTMLPVINPRHERDLLIIDFGGVDRFENHNGSYMPCVPAFREYAEASYSRAKSNFTGYIDKWMPGFVGIDNNFGFDTGSFEPCGVDSLVLPPKFRNPRDCRKHKVFSTCPDFLELNTFNSAYAATLRDVLKHKVIIYYKENLNKALGFGAIAGRTNQFLVQGLLSGNNYWVMARFPFTERTSFELNPFQYGIGEGAASLTTTYSRFFGIRGGYVSAWFGMGASRKSDTLSPLGKLPAMRNEDFIGAAPSELVSAAEFPPLSVDIGRLDTMLFWADSNLCVSDNNKVQQYPFLDSMGGGLPEVAFTIPNTAAGTETLYLYKSRFGENKYPYFKLPFNDYQGTVVAVRLDGGFFRTSHWQFTPIPLDPVSFQPAFNTMMDWLFARPWGGPGFGRGSQPISQPDGKYASEIIYLHREVESARQQMLDEAFGGQRYFKNQLEFEPQLKSYLEMKRIEEATDAQVY